MDREFGFSLPTEQTLSNGSVMLLTYPPRVPIFDERHEVIGVASLVSIIDDEANYDSSIPLEGRSISGSWKRTEAGMTLVDVVFFNSPGQPT